MKRTAENLIAILRAEIGYHEKASNSDLDSKTGNSGDRNFQKYGRDLAGADYYNGNKNGFAWCDQFVDWGFWMLCDKDKTAAEKMTCQTGPLGAGVEFSAQYYRQQGRLDHNPRVGDQCFFGDFDHTGVVTSVNGKYLTVIEGNKHDAVSENPYYIGDGWLSNWFGHPYYEESDTPAPMPKPKEDDEMYNRELFVRDIQNVTGCDIDGKAGSQTLAAVPTVSMRRNEKHKVILPVQKRLAALGHYKGTFDGEAGQRFDEAVKAFQKSIDNPHIDGELTAGQRTWRYLLQEE